MPGRSCSPATPHPETDAGLVLRVAAASADSGLPIGAATLSRLAASAPEMPIPWPQRRHWTTFWSCSPRGPPRWRPIEALDRTGLWEPVAAGVGSRSATFRPATSRTSGRWTATSSRPPSTRRRWPPGWHGPICSRWVRCCTTSARAGESTTVCSGPRWPSRSRPRLGVAPKDAEFLSKLVRHHLLLPVTATRSDLNDPKTIEMRVRGAGRGSAPAGGAARADRGGLEGDGPRGVERLEGVPGRGAGASLPAGDGGRAAAAGGTNCAAVSFAGGRPRCACADRGRRRRALQPGDGRAGPARIGVERRRGPRAELAPHPFGLGQHPRRCGDHRIRGLAAVRLTARCGPAAPAVHQRAQR